MATIEIESHAPMDTQGNSVNRSLLKATFRRGMKPAVRRFLGVPELPFRS